MSCGSKVDELELIVRVELRDKSPREVREAFAAAIKEEIFEAAASGRIDLAVAEELYRVVPREGEA